MALLEISNLETYYGKACSLQGVSLTVEPGSITAIIGQNGAGKSTLLDAILGHVDIRGEIRFDQEDNSGKPPQARVRAGIGYAPERGHLFPYPGVRDNLPVGACTAPGDTERNLGIVYGPFPVLRDRQAQETRKQSGGERQMVSLGRALMSSPRLLIVDEPTIGLAPKVCQDISDAHVRMNRSYNLTILLTEQNVNFALHLARTIHVLVTGEIRLSGTAYQLRDNAHVREAYFGGDADNTRNKGNSDGI
ncbi:MAG: ABC transporter ATP-binding protein [Rhodobacteraceae bacterium]|nr:ABC transporter ATP-binding protein [Paracoccaceae bacterium]MCY4141022.1 ABC transporter ATP-binding protein [Paracoccaceae bacterium]